MTSDARPILAAPRKQGRKVPILLIVCLGVMALVGSFFVADPVVRLGVLTFGAATIVFCGLFAAYRFMQKRKQTYATQALISLVENDASPCFLADLEGEVSFRNEAATDRFRDRAVDTLGRAFSELFANPGAVLYRLQSKAQALGSAREDIVTRKGHIRLSVNAVDGGM